MTIEVKIHKIMGYKIINEGSVLEWKWCGDPYNVINFYNKLTSSLTNKIMSTKVNPKIIEAIKLADETECLTSKSEYIRECKKWLLNIGDKD